jgi:hydroxymethylglutaryl-CoA reductase
MAEAVFPPYVAETAVERVLVTRVVTAVADAVCWPGLIVTEVGGTLNSDGFVAEIATVTAGAFAGIGADRVTMTLTVATP